MAVDKKTNAVLLAGVAAAATGVLVAVGVQMWRERQEQSEQHLRDVQDVLGDCYHKIEEIEARLSVNPGPKALRKSVAAPETTATGNGSPTYENV